MKYQILQGDNRDTLKTLADNSIDAIVTDPPYGIDFLGKAWDANTGALETYQECLRVLKPGGHIVAFSAARTYHHLAVTLEQAGFEIRDQIMWIYSSGFPKSQDVGKSIQRSLGVKEKTKLKSNGPANGLSRMTFNQSDPAKFEETKDVDTVVCTDPEAKAWEGWGTALKPAHEPIVLARKPLKGSIRENCLKYGTGALNIDATRVAYADLQDQASIDHKVPTKAWSGHTLQTGSYEKDQFVQVETNELGRFPSNVIGEIPDYQKYFYCPKVSRKERHTGFDLETIPSCGTTHMYDPVDQAVTRENKPKGGNNHPTVKPIELMKYLIKLITPPGGIVLDPFNGSGSTGCAAVELGFEYIGCELDPNYVDISLKRIAAWNQEDNIFNELFE